MIVNILWIICVRNLTYFSKKVKKFRDGIPLEPLGTTEENLRFRISVILFDNSFLKNQNLMKNLIKLKNNKTLLLIYRFVIYLCKLALKLQFALDSCNIQQVAQCRR